MLMCCFDGELWAKLPETQKGKIMQEYDELMQAIGKSGHLRASVKLQRARPALLFARTTAIAAEQGAKQQQS
jgi:hypothetical protein